MQDKNSKIKILYIYPSLGVGGAEELRLLALQRLQQRDTYEIKVCCIEKLGEIGEKIRDLGIEVFCLNKKAKPNNLSATLSLLKYLLRNKFDIVQTSLFHANFHGRIAAALARVPIIISEEHSEHYQYRSLKFLPYIWSDKILSIFTKKIICCSQNLMDSIAKLEGLPEKKLYLLLNTFNADKLKVTKSPGELKAELGLFDNELVIGNVASLSYRKGQDLLIKAFKIINDRLPCTRLVFVGDEVCEFKQGLLRLVSEFGLEGKVLFLGQRPNVADYLNIMDVFVLSSRFEGIPLVLLEAMYMQIPVVAARVGGVPEAIRDGKNGILTEPGNIASIANAVIKFLNDKEKRLKLSGEARRTVLEDFNAERHINRLENLYSEFCNNGRLRRKI